MGGERFDLFEPAQYPTVNIEACSVELPGNGFGGELLAEYPASGAAASPQKEYGYRNGQLLISADAPTSNSATFINTDTTTQGS